MAMAVQEWPDVEEVRGIHPAPIIRLDGTVASGPGYDPESGWFLTVAKSRQLPGTQRLRDLAAQGWRGPVSELAPVLAWSGTAKALGAELRKLAPTLEAAGVTVRRTTMRDPQSRLWLWEINDSNGSDESKLALTSRNAASGGPLRTAKAPRHFRD